MARLLYMDSGSVAAVPRPRPPDRRRRAVPAGRAAGEPEQASGGHAQGAEDGGVAEQLATGGPQRLSQQGMG
jgi:hypothetical protein